jgi:hypothetical protein
MRSIGDQVSLPGGQLGFCESVPPLERSVVDGKPQSDLTARRLLPFHRAGPIP